MRYGGLYVNAQFSLTTLKGGFSDFFLEIAWIAISFDAVLTRNIHLLVDAWIWNGFLIREGVSIRL